MIFITGDTHGTLDINKVIEFFADEEFTKKLSKQDYLILLGDTAICWDDGKIDGEVKQILRSLPVTTLFIDGNHDNHRLIAEYPVLEWNGGSVHEIEPDILHLMRGDVFTIENKKDANYAELYKMIRNMNYKEYAKKYLLNDTYATVEDLETDASLHCISDYLRNNNNYKIYHALDDYLVNSNQLAKLKDYCKDNLVLMNNGSHLGFLYRKEFIETLKQEITLKDDLEILNTKGEL